MTETGNSQRVTNAILGGKMDSVAFDVIEIKKCIDRMDLYVRENTEARQVNNERWRQHDHEHESLNAKKWAGDIGAAVAGAFVGLAAALTKS